MESASKVHRHGTRHNQGRSRKPEITTAVVAAAVVTLLSLILIGCDQMTAKPGTEISIEDTRIPESDDGRPTEARFTVTLNPAGDEVVDEVVTVDYTTGDGTAEAGIDYTEKRGTLTFQAGETAKTIIVAIIDDTAVEPYETFTVTLRNPSNATLADADAVGTITNDDTKIYYADSGWERGAPSTILRANLDGTDVERLVTSDLVRDDVRGVALDIAGGSDKVYWTVYWPDGEDKIQRANLDGSDVETVITGGNPWEIALDAAGGKMYWTKAGGIWRANLDGSNAEPLLTTTEVSTPIGIALDLANGKMYWTDRGERVDDGTPPIGNIKRANLDGSDVEVLVDVTYWPDGIAVDAASGKMYWTSRGSDRWRIVQRANLDGSDVEILRGGGGFGIALDVEYGKMYLANFSAIQRADLNGSNVEDLVTETRFLGGIAIDLALR